MVFPMPQERTKPQSPKKPVLVFFPTEALEALNAAVRAEDTDRSKFIRKAVRAALRNR
jgi:metal-responsive CopG/Arc/MetJ family transcriptional regulator